MEKKLTNSFKTKFGPSFVRLDITTTKPSSRRRHLAETTFYVTIILAGKPSNVADFVTNGLMDSLKTQGLCSGDNPCQVSKPVVKRSAAKSATTTTIITAASVSEDSTVADGSSSPIVGAVVGVLVVAAVVVVVVVIVVFVLGRGQEKPGPENEPGPIASSPMSAEGSSPLEMVEMASSIPTTSTDPVPSAVDSIKPSALTVASAQLIQTVVEANNLSMSAPVTVIDSSPPLRRRTDSTPPPVPSLPVTSIEHLRRHTGSSPPPVPPLPVTSIERPCRHTGSSPSNSDPVPSDDASPSTVAVNKGSGEASFGGTEATSV